MNKVIMRNRILPLITGAFFLMICSVIYQANTGKENLLFELVGAIPYGDKLGHFILFGTLTYLAIIASHYRTLKIMQLNSYVSVAMIVVFVVIEELSQLFIASRTFDLSDLAMDFFGIGAAALFATIYRKPS